MLNVLSATIPYLSAKVSSKVFSELCKLMASQFSPLTRQILKAIDTIFKNSEDKTIVPEIEGVITSLTSYLSLHDKNPADTIVHMTTLLKSALEKANSVEPTLCLKKLPLVCGSLAGFFPSRTFQHLASLFFIVGLNFNISVVMNSNFQFICFRPSDFHGKSCIPSLNYI